MKNEATGRIFMPLFPNIYPSLWLEIKNNNKSNETIIITQHLFFIYVLDFF